MVRLPRFKLKWLFIAVALCAVICATIWQFWPRYRAYLSRTRFETAAAAFSDGMSVDDIGAIVGSGSWGAYSSDAQGEMVGLVPYFLEGAWYCVYLKLDPNTPEHTCSVMPSTSVETYRLTVPPKVYEPQTQAGRDQVFPPESMRTSVSTPSGVMMVRAPPKEGETARRAAYVQDFYELISQRSPSGVDISYERLPKK